MSWLKKIIGLRKEINDRKQIIETINKAISWFFLKSNETDKALAGLITEKEKDH